MTFTAKPKDGAVWITGASEGIGKSVAIQMADEGYKVYISARSFLMLVLLNLLGEMI